MKTEIRVVELSEFVDGEFEHEYAIQYRNDQGPWTTVPVTRVFSRAEFDRLKKGEE